MTFACCGVRLMCRRAAGKLTDTYIPPGKHLEGLFLQVDFGLETPEIGSGVWKHRTIRKRKAKTIFHTIEFATIFTHYLHNRLDTTLILR